MKICLDEIRRCQRVTPKPNFIVLLGGPLPGWREEVKAGINLCPCALCERKI
jgi:hypothetical protein